MSNASNSYETRLSQSAFASVAQRYWNTEWSPAQNAEVYGDDASEEGLGHNLQLQLTIRGPSGLSEVELKSQLEAAKVLIDHQCLFGANRPALVSGLPDQAITLERLTLLLAAEVFTHNLRVGKWDELTVWETDRVGCSVRPEGLSAQRVEMHFRRYNLTLNCVSAVNPSTGLAVSRAAVGEAVDPVFRDWRGHDGAPQGEWGQILFQQLKARLPILESLRIDLPRHEFLIVR